MGGNAIPKARRISKEVYDKVIKHITGASYYVPSNDLGGPDHVVIRGEVVKSYHQKQDFGDIDVVIDDRVDITHLFAHYRPKKCAVNGNVMSIAYDGIQVDFIRTPVELLQSTLDYYAYNDLGNLMGKLARGLGFKYGNKGLMYRYRDPNKNVIEDILVTRDHKEILTALGLSHSRYSQGFDTMGNMFKFISSALYFDSGMYLLENVPGRDRNRDSKRPTYLAFLEWLKAEKIQTAAERGDGNTLKARLTDAHWRIWESYPHVAKRIKVLDHEREQERLFRTRFNGSVIAELTGLSGNDLGKFAEWFRERHSKDDLMLRDDGDLKSVVVAEYLDYEALNKEKA
jgi:hypothetical protein